MPSNTFKYIKNKTVTTKSLTIVSANFLQYPVYDGQRFLNQTASSAVMARDTTGCPSSLVFKGGRLCGTLLLCRYTGGLSSWDDVFERGKRCSRQAPQVCVRSLAASTYYLFEVIGVETLGPPCGWGLPSAHSLFF